MEEIMVGGEENLERVKQKCFELLCVTRDLCEKYSIWYSLALGTMLGAVRHQGFIPWDSDVDIFVMLPDKDKFRKAVVPNLPSWAEFHNFDAEPHNVHSHDYIQYVGETEDVHIDIYYLCGAPTDEKQQARFAVFTSYTDRIVRSKYNRIMDCKKKNRVLVFFAKIIDYCIPDKVLKKFITYKEQKYNFEGAEYVISLANWGTATACIPKRIFDEMIKQPFNGELFDIPKEYDVFLRRTYGDDYMTPKKY